MLQPHKKSQMNHLAFLVAVVVTAAYLTTDLTRQQTSVWSLVQC